MPCWERNTMSLNLNSGQRVYIDEVLEELNIRHSPIKWRSPTGSHDDYLDFTLSGVNNGGKNYRMGINLDKGTFVFGSESKELVDVANAIRRGISRKVVEAVARKKRWVIKNVGPNKMRARRY